MASDDTSFTLERVGAPDDPTSFLELRAVGQRAGHGVRCDLSTVSLRGGLSQARAMPIAKALGDARTVVDATAGLLCDAFLLAVAGFEVLALERSPWVYQLAADGLARAKHDVRLSAHIGALDAPDAVVIDPMFPPKKKRSALPRKEMVVLREVVGTDVDAQELLAAARACARQRVVLKRGDDAVELATADWNIEGTTVRFDVWRCG